MEIRPDEELIPPGSHYFRDHKQKEGYIGDQPQERC